MVSGIEANFTRAEGVLAVASFFRQPHRLDQAAFVVQIKHCHRGVQRIGGIEAPLGVIQRKTEGAGLGLKALCDTQRRRVDREQGAMVILIGAVARRGRIQGVAAGAVFELIEIFGQRLARDAALKRIRGRIGRFGSGLSGCRCSVRTGSGQHHPCQQR